jgi:hypothetical protein
MVRIDDPTIYNPFGWRLADLADPATSLLRRRQLIEDLIAWEAEELAHGYRHLTIVHGDPRDLDASRHLSAFSDILGTVAARAGWVRARGTADYVTITVHGPQADEQISEFAAVAYESSREDWTITPSAYPPDLWGA